MDYEKFYIDGVWVDPRGNQKTDVVNPATEGVIARVSLGNTVDVDHAVAAARRAFEKYARSSRGERIALFKRIIAVYDNHYDEIAEAISQEIGAPIGFSKELQALTGKAHFATALAILKDYAFDEDRGATRIVKEPISVCGLITPWNWPINQIVCKLAPALAVGCTVVLKPSEIAPLSAMALAKVLDDADLPNGVFNLVNGDGAGVGQYIASHKDIDMVSFTGSTRGGIAVAKAAADTVKRVSQELGGKSPNIILEDADLEAAVTGGVLGVMANSGQSCNAPTRMLVPADLHDKAVANAKMVAESIKLGAPEHPGTQMGPVVSERQWNAIQELIGAGVDEGATLVCGGLGRPDDLELGYYVKPTVFANVQNDMRIAREEVFGPVLCIIPYKDDEEAIAIANDTVYGLSAYVQSADLDRARAVAARLRAGMVHRNGASVDFNAPFGGYKHSGNGREWGAEGLDEFVEIKAVMGHNPLASAARSE